MDGSTLVAAAALLGVAGLPHCAAMCAAPCAAATARAGTPGQWAFQLARLAGYAAAGAVAAAGVAALRDGLAGSAALRPLWTLLHLLALALGVWLAATGRWPAALQRAAASPSGGWQPVVWAGTAGLRSAAAGAAWIAWPCALSQGALVVAALGETPAQGAAAMATFALVSSPALWLGPVLVRRFGAPRADAATWPLGAIAAALPLRAAGVLLAAGSAWALGGGLWQRVVDWCT